MSKQTITQQGRVYTVAVLDKEADEYPDYNHYHVCEEATGLECDGDADGCEEGTCSHIRAVKRFQKAQQKPKQPK